MTFIQIAVSIQAKMNLMKRVFKLDPYKAVFFFFPSDNPACQCFLNLVYFPEQGFVLTEGEGIQLVSNIIKNTLDIETAVLMGANLATEVASEMFCETTIGEEQQLQDDFFNYLGLLLFL